MKTLRILLTGGGSGGHIFPLLAVAQELKNQAEQFGIMLDIRYFGAAYEYAQELVNNNIEFVPIISSKLRRYWSLLNLIDIFKFILSVCQLLWKVFWFMPEVIFSKGGPGSLAVVLVGKLYLIPVVIHESDSVPGLTNAISGKLAKKIFAAFGSVAAYFSGRDLEIIGNPVRTSLFDNEKDSFQAKKSFGFNLDQPLLFILGGSQGAEKLNNFVLENLELLMRDFQILHQVGRLNYDQYKKEVEFVTKYWSDMVKSRYYFKDFFDKELGDALLAADIVFSRAGSGSIFEIAAFGKPAILVPLPGSANDHQRENAEVYQEAGAAIVIQEENLLSNLFIEEAGSLFQDKGLLQKMSESARSFYRPDAAQVIAKYLLTYTP